MARYRGPIVKISRREGIPLSPKAERYFAKKQGRVLPPGQHGQRRANKPSEYAKRLREKQKARHFFGVMERQFQRYFDRASHEHGNTGENLLRMLEMRLDNVVRRLGFANSMRGARQLTTHGHVLVNNRKVDIPSYNVNLGDRISLKDGFRKNAGVMRALEDAVSRGLPGWLEWESGLSEAVKRAKDTPIVDGVALAGKVKSLPAREEMSLPVNEQLIVELYSK